VTLVLTDLRTVNPAICRLRRIGITYFNSNKLFIIQFATKYVKIKIYKSVILPVVLHGCGAWSVILEEKPGLKSFENMALRIYLGPRVGR